MLCQWAVMAMSTGGFKRLNIFFEDRSINGPLVWLSRAVLFTNGIFVSKTKALEWKVVFVGLNHGPNPFTPVSSGSAKMSKAICLHLNIDKKGRVNPRRWGHMSPPHTQLKNLAPIYIEEKRCLPIVCIIILLSFICIIFSVFPTPPLCRHFNVFLKSPSYYYRARQRQRFSDLNNRCVPLLLIDDWSISRPSILQRIQDPKDNKCACAGQLNFGFSKSCLIQNFISFEVGQETLYEVWSMLTS